MRMLLETFDQFVGVWQAHNVKFKVERMQRLGHFLPSNISGQADWIILDQILAACNIEIDFWTYIQRQSSYSFNLYFSGWICSPISAPSILVSCSSFAQVFVSILFIVFVFIIQSFSLLKILHLHVQSCCNSYCWIVAFLKILKKLQKCHLSDLCVISN